MWVEYYQIGSAILKEKKLKYLVIENEDSNIIIATNIYSYIICLKGKPTCKLGMMKVHLNALSEFNKALEPYKELLMPKEE